MDTSVALFVYCYLDRGPIFREDDVAAEARIFAVLSKVNEGSVKCVPIVVHHIPIRLVDVAARMRENEFVRADTVQRQYKERGREGTRGDT